MLCITKHYTTNYDINLIYFTLLLKFEKFENFSTSQRLRELICVLIDLKIKNF